MSIVDTYQREIFDIYMQTHPKANPSIVSDLISQYTQQHFRDIPCVLDNNMTREKITTNMTDMFDWMGTRNPIISGNGTFFKQHSEYLSPNVKTSEILQMKRKKVKNSLWSLPKGSIEYVNKNTDQKSIKVVMNADYGGSATPLSPFYSYYIPPSTTATAKNITTTLICCLELFSSNDNAWSKLQNINELFDMILIVLRRDPTEDMNLISDIFSVDEVCGWLSSKVNNMTLSDIKMLKSFLSTLSVDQLSKLMFAFNPRLVLRNYVADRMCTIMDYLKSNRVSINNIATKEDIHRVGYGVKAPEAIADDIEYVCKLIVDNCVYPFIPNDAEMRATNMQRVIVCVTDTDSLMIQFANYIDDFQARVSSFKESCLIASAFGMRLFIEHVIPVMVENIATYCNINDKYYRDKFVFKNEFAFLSMALFAKKMYAASMFVQEGTPRDPHDIAITGLSFKKRDSAEFLEPIMLELYDKYVLTNDDVDVSGILDEFYSLRDKIVANIQTDTSYYKVLSVKEASSYDSNKVLPAQMRGTIVWNNMMPDEEILPMDRVIVIPLSFKLLHEHSDIPEVSEILRLVSIDNPKEQIDPYFCLPEYYHEIPVWLHDVIDVEVAVDKLLTPFKQLLGLFDVNMPETRGGMIPSRMVCI